MLPLPLPNGMTISIKEEKLLDCLEFKKFVNGGFDASGDLAEVCSYIKDVADKFFDYEPWELPELTKLGRGNGLWYFFYRRVRKYPKGQCWKRTTNTGSYNETGDPSIENAKKRILVYYEGRGSKATKTDWVLYEYESGNTDGDSGNYVVGCLMENHILKRKRKKMSGRDLEEDNLASASKAPVPVAENGNVLSCSKEKPSKRKKTSDEVQFSSNAASVPDILVPVPVMQPLEKENRGFPTQVECQPSKPQTEKGCTSMVYCVNSHLPCGHNERQYQITSMEYATTGGKFNHETGYELPNRSVAPSWQLQMEKGPLPTNFSISGGSIVDYNKLQISGNTLDISDQEIQKENGLSLMDFSSPVGSPINHCELQPCPNMAGDETHLAQSLEISNQETHTQQQLHCLEILKDHGTPYNVDISRSCASSYDQNWWSNAMKKLTPEVHSLGEAGLGSTFLSTHFPSSTHAELPSCSSTYLSCTRQQLPVFASAENGGHTELSEPSLCYRDESFCSETTSELLNDHLMSPSWGISLEELLRSVANDCSTDAIGGTPSNSI